MRNVDLYQLGDLAKPQVQPPLDPSFRPAVVANREYQRLVRESGGAKPVSICLERADGTRSRCDLGVLPEGHPRANLNVPYVERIVKFGLWQKGGCTLYIGGAPEIAQALACEYSPDGARAFDFNFMGRSISERTFELKACPLSEVPSSHETSMAIGRHLEGCRIGFDLGASDRKAAAVIDGEPVYSEEVVWEPREQTDPAYHFNQIMAGLKSAAEKMPRVDAIGGSSAGVILNNRPMVASLFRGVPPEQFDKVKSLFIDIGQAWGVPIEVANDGDVTALAGAMSLDDTCVLGVAMGSSEAVGYVNEQGNITGWLNELAFAPIDYSQNAPPDEWSGDYGCGVQYLTQQAVFRLAKTVGIELDESMTLAARLKTVQNLLEGGDPNARQIWETIGVYMGYAIAHYADFYPIRQMLVLGRVTSGIGGGVVLEQAQEVLDTEFPEVARSIEIHLPDEKTRRVGQAVAAASLPDIKK